MNWSDVGNAVARIAPTIAGTLVNVVVPGSGGVVAELAAAGIGALREALGLPPDATPDQAMDAIKQADPDMLLKLKQADQNYQIKLKEADVDLERVYAADRGNARNMTIETGNRTPYIFGIIVTLMMGGILAILVKIVIPPENRDIFFYLAGQLSGVFGMFATFLYGKDRDSKMTAQLLAASSPPNATAAGWKIDRGK